MSIFGSVSTGRAGEKVIIQFKACGLSPAEFRDTYETTTNSGGGFVIDQPGPFSPGISGVFRAVQGDAVSSEVPVRHQATVRLRPVSGGRFEAIVTGRVQFWRRYVVLQRFERARGRWVDGRRIVLTKQWSSGSSGAVTVVTEPFRPLLARGTQVRVMFPLSQARPCYRAGVSEVRRT